MLRFLVLSVFLSCGIADVAGINLSTQFLERHGARRLPFKVDIYEQGLFYTELDTNLRDLLLIVRNLSQLLALNQIDRIKEQNLKAGRMQEPVPENIEFPCDLTQARSPEPPSAISQLRPGDIDIVAAIGDSSNAGTGIMGLSTFDSHVEYRGYCYTGGGFENWHTALTLPNILKLFNPKLYGYAVSHSLSADVELARLSLSEPMLTVQDLPFQALVLIDRLRKSSNVNMQDHWKLLNIQVGANDICSEICNWPDTEAFLRMQARQLHETFRLLRDHVPRLLINFIILPDVDELVHLISLSPPDCVQKIPFYCSCFAQLGQEHYRQAAKRIRDEQKRLVQLHEFRRDDFAIVTHEILGNMSSLWSRNGFMQRRFFANDCIHYSQLGHAVLAKILWNSMLQKTDLTTAAAWQDPFKDLICPTADNQFLKIFSDQI